MAKTLRIEEIEKCIQPAIMLRTPEQSIIDEYADAMKNGVVFPPIVLGINAKKKEEIALVDGLHRVRAARQAGILELSVIEKLYSSPDALLADMYLLNKHGARVRPEDRDARIRLLAEKYAWKQEKIGKEFGLDQSSVSRVLAGKQKAGKAGGEGETKDRTKFKPLTGKSLIALAEKMVRSIKTATTKGDLVELCWTKESEGVTTKELRKGKDNLDTLKELKDQLLGFFEALEKEERKG